MSGPTTDRRQVAMLAPRPETLTFLRAAILEHRRLFRRNGAVVPLEIADVLAYLESSLGVSEGQDGPSPAAAARTEQVVPMTPRAVTYSTAADLLEISVSSLKRRVAAGDLHPISIGGSARIRVTDLDNYLDRLTEQEMTK